MSSFVYIELDTKSPNLEIYAPSYTTTDLDNTIILESDESLSGFQEIYLIDSEGVRHDYTFNNDGNMLIGKVNFTNFPLGIATIYARVKDEVDNVSELISKLIDIKESLSLLRLDIQHRIMSIDTNNKSAIIGIEDRVANIEIGEVR